MTRLSFRPRPLDVNKKLPIVRSIKDLDGEDGIVNRSVHHGHIALDAENEPVLASPAKKGDPKEIPIPESQTVNEYETLYPRAFQQPATYVRRRPARAETEIFVEYDLDDEDEDWLENYNNERDMLAPEKLEAMLYHLELADSRARMKNMSAAAAADSQVAAPPPFVLGVRVPVYLPMAHAEEILKSDCSETSVVSLVCEYWRIKREKWGKPLLRRLQPPPAVTDTNPYNVFRPREKAHRPNTRRMQRRENDVGSFEKMQQVKKSLEDAQKLLRVMQKREEAKKELMDCEFELQRAALKDRNVAKIYLERERKRMKLLEQASLVLETPGGPRLKVHPPAPPEDTSDHKSSLTKDSALDVVNKALNTFHTPVVTTKRRSASAAIAATQATATAAPTAVLAAAAASSGGSFPPPPPVSKLRLPSPSPEGTARGTGTDGMEEDRTPEIHQLQLQKRKRRRNTFPLRGAAAASAANARLKNKAQEGAVAGVNRVNDYPVLKEPPRPVEPVMWFTLPVNLQLLQKHLQVDCSTKGACTVSDGHVNSDIAGELQRTTEPVCPQFGSSEKSSAVPSLEDTDQKDQACPFLGFTAQGLQGSDGITFQSMRGRPRFGRGGRLVFDRWDVLRGVPLGGELDGSAEPLEGPREKENVLGQDVGKLSPPSEEKGMSPAPLSLRFAVHKHRSQPRWRHTTAKPLTPESPADSSDVASVEVPIHQHALEVDKAELPPLMKVSPRAICMASKGRPSMSNKNGIQKTMPQHGSGMHHEKGMRPPVPRNGLHAPVQHLVPA